MPIRAPPATGAKFRRGLSSTNHEDSLNEIIETHQVIKHLLITTKHLIAYLIKLYSNLSEIDRLYNQST